LPFWPVEGTKELESPLLAVVIALINKISMRTIWAMAAGGENLFG
jgi:hypothetical protein